MKEVMNKGSLYLLFLLMIVLLFVACSADNEEAGADNDEQEPVQLTFSTWGSEGHIAMYEELLEEFYEENPHIDVTIDTSPEADYQQRMSVLAAGNELPDVGWVAERMVPQFVSNGILMDITRIKDEESFEFEDYFDSTLELWEHEGQLLGLPFSTPPMILFFNQSLFDEAGIENPNELYEQGEWTWDKLEEVAKEISEVRDEVYGMNLWIDWTNWSALPSHTHSYGGEIFNEDMTEFLWNSSEGVSTFEFMDRVMFEDRSHVPPGEEIPFEGGNVGMFTFMYSYIANVRDIEEFEWDITPMPEGPNGTFPLLGQAGYAAFEGSDHPEEAYELLKFLGSKTGIQASSAYFVPPRESVLESDEFVEVANNPPRESVERALINQMESGYVYPLHEDWTQIESAITQGFDKLFSEMETPERILEEMESDIDPILND